MNEPIVVEIIGAPIACKEGVKDAWREVADWAAVKLKTYFGDRVRLDYFDLFNPSCPTIPPDGQLPMVLINGSVISRGGKISIPLIRKKIEEMDIVS